MTTTAPTANPASLPNIDVAAFLAHLKAHEPARAANSVSGPEPLLENDLSDGPDAVALDGWWLAQDLEAAIRAAVATPPTRPRNGATSA